MEILSASALVSVSMLLALSLGVFLVAALAPYRKVVRTLGKPYLAVFIGTAALCALLYHILPHFVEFVETSFKVTGPWTYVYAGLPFLAIAGLSYWVEMLYHSHEHEVEHVEHIPELPAWGTFSSTIRMVVLATHSFLDGHIMASIGLGFMAIPFVLHKAVDGLVVNGERSTHREHSAWRWRIGVQLLATSAGAFLHLEGVPELVHIGLVAAVLGLYTGALRDYVKEYRLFLKYHPEMRKNVEAL